MKVGIIANPESGKDMRRIVSDAFTFNNFEKLNIIKRIIRTALDFGETEFVFMPEKFGFGKYAKEEFGNVISTLPFSPENENDTVKSAKIMEQTGVCCIVVLGGDGTNRLTAKGIKDTPLIPVSTGTNNAFPEFYEGTDIGIALAAIRKSGGIKEAFLKRQKKLEILKNEKPVDIALVDIAIMKGDFIGSKAVMELDKIKEVFVSFAEPGVIGISSIFAYHTPVKRDSRMWGKCELGEKGIAVKVPVMPGKTDIVKIENIEILYKKEKVPVSFHPSIAALDGERTIYVDSEDFFIRMNPNGPYVLDIEKILSEIPTRKFFVL